MARLIHELFFLFVLSQVFDTHLFDTPQQGNKHVTKLQLEQFHSIPSIHTPADIPCPLPPPDPVDVQLNGGVRYIDLRISKARERGRYTSVGPTTYQNVTNYKAGDENFHDVHGLSYGPVIPTLTTLRWFLQRNPTEVLIISVRPSPPPFHFTHFPSFPLCSQRFD